MALVLKCIHEPSENFPEGNVKLKYFINQFSLLFQVLDSEYVVSLLDVFPQGLGFVLVFEYMLSDLGEIIANDANAAIASINCCATKTNTRGNFIFQSK